jgi:hypothetical protein
MPQSRKERRAMPGRKGPVRGAPAVLLFLASAAAGFGSGAAAIHLLGRSAASTQIAPPSVPPVFTDVAASAGIGFRHEAGNRGKYYYPEVMGAGCAALDFDGDGRLDIFFVNGNLLPPERPSQALTDALYRNRGDGTFEDVTARAGVGDPSYGQGCCSADYDGDGDQDLYITNYGPNVLYRNRGDGTFEDFTAGAGVADPGWSQSCTFFDADGDGWLDLYVQHYLEYSIEGHKDWPILVGGKEVLDYCSPSGYRGQQDHIFRNRGDGTFRDATAESGIVMPEGTGMGLACADFDCDGDTDVFVANDSRPNFLFTNDGRGRFTECGLARGVAFNGEGGVEAFMGADPGDYDGDGLLDIAVPSLRSEGFNLFRNLGKMFADVASAAGLDATTGASTGFAPVFLDWDSDGDLDLFFTCGEVRMGRAEAGASGTFEERYAMKSLLLENREGRFADVSDLAGPFFGERLIGRSCAAGDFDDDGDEDLLVTVMGGGPRLLRNDTRKGHWIGFRLEGNPPNRDSIGARLSLTAGGRTQVREVFGGGSYLGQRDRRQLFGLGAATSIERLVVRWPGKDGGETVHTGLAVDRYHVLKR